MKAPRLTLIKPKDVWQTNFHHLTVKRETQRRPPPTTVSVSSLCYKFSCDVINKLDSSQIRKPLVHPPRLAPFSVMTFISFWSDFAHNWSSAVRGYLITDAGRHAGLPDGGPASAPTSGEPSDSIPGRLGSWGKRVPPFFQETKQDIPVDPPPSWGGALFISTTEQPLMEASGEKESHVDDKRNCIRSQNTVTFYEILRLSSDGKAEYKRIWSPCSHILRITPCRADLQPWAVLEELQRHRRCLLYCAPASSPHRHQGPGDTWEIIRQEKHRGTDLFPIIASRTQKNCC